MPTLKLAGGQLCAAPSAVSGEQLVRERRALKLEKKQAAAEAAREAERAEEGGSAARRVANRD
jgi:hypothetical protein